MNKIFIIIFMFCILLGLLGCEQIATTTFPETTTEETTTSETRSVQENLELIMNSIEIPAELTEDLELPAHYSYEGIEADASWHSTASSVITSAGVVSITSYDQTATLVLTLSIGEVSVFKNFDVVVLGNVDYLLLYAVLHNQIDFGNGQVSENLVLPETYIQDNKVVEATWISSNEEFLEADGTIHPGQQSNQVTLYLKLTYNGVFREDSFTLTILPDPNSLPINWWHTVDVYTGAIVGEALDPSVPSCFHGAVYRKVVSSKDYWLGIEAVVTIPEFIPDVDRYDATKPSYFLDNASLYMGGNAYSESDVGLTWSIGYFNSESTSYTTSGIAFRPFWRYITSVEACTNNNCYRNANVNDFQFYYFPGDTIRMSVISPTPGYMQMRIELLSLTTNEHFVDARARYGLGDDFERVFVTNPFPSAGMGAAKAEFKRVNAIDQVANEGKPTLNTNSVVENSIWHEVYLYRMIDGVLYRVPMVDTRSASMTCPLGTNINGDFSNAYEISYEGVDQSLGGEVVTLNPNNGTGKLYNTEMIILNDQKRFAYL